MNALKEFELETMAEEVIAYDTLYDELDEDEIVEIIKYYYEKCKKLKKSWEKMNMERVGKYNDGIERVKKFEKQVKEEKNKKIKKLKEENESLRNLLQEEIDDTIIIVKNLEEENEKLKKENEELKEWKNKTLDYDYFVEYYDKHKMNEKNEIRILELEKEKEELETIIKKASKSNPDHNEPIIYCKECVTWTNDWNDDSIELKCCLECLPENYGYCEECVKWKPWGEICDVGELCNDCYVSDAED